VAPSESTEVRRYGLIGGTHDDVLRLAKKLQAAHPGAALRFCYESRAARLSASPLSPSPRLRMHPGGALEDPRKPGERVKTDRRDADQLARLYRAGELTALHVPDPQDEAVRDLLRARDQVRQQQHRARQRNILSRLRHSCTWNRLNKDAQVCADEITQSRVMNGLRTTIFRCTRFSRGRPTCRSRMVIW
jgi:transposase